MEFSQSGGSLHYSGVLADMRTYLMPVKPYTIALRGMYYGRFGDGRRGCDVAGALPRLSGSRARLRPGPRSSRANARRCRGRSCPAFDRLIGSRVAIANAEVRFPIWGAFGGNQFYGPLPIEGAFFTDAGVAWGQSLRAGTLPGDNQPVFSVGAALRVNVFNFAVAEIDFVQARSTVRRAGGCGSSSSRPGF